MRPTFGGEDDAGAGAGAGAADLIGDELPDDALTGEEDVAAFTGEEEVAAFTGEEDMPVFTGEEEAEEETEERADDDVGLAELDVTAACKKTRTKKV